MPSVFHPARDSIKVLSLPVSKGQEFPVVALVGVGRMPVEGEYEREEARLLPVRVPRQTAGNCFKNRLARSTASSYWGR